MRSAATSFGFGALALRPGGSGVQTYSRELLRALAPHLRGHSARAVVQADAVAELPPSVSPIAVRKSSGAIRALQGLRPRRGFDLFHSLDVDLPVFGPSVRVATVHDLSVFDVPWAFGRMRALGEQRLLRASFARADHLFAVSDFTAERLYELFGRESTVTHLAPAPWTRVPTDAEVADVRARYRLPEKFVIQVGTVEPRKDIGLVSRAAAALDIPFVLVGGGSDGPGTPTRSIGLGYVPTADLPALYRAATVTAYASHYEGFGLPPVEAMACGGAVVASHVGALPQVVGDGAVLVPRHDEQSWIDSMRPLVKTEPDRLDLCARAARVASRMTWESTALATVAGYRKVGIQL